MKKKEEEEIYPLRNVQITMQTIVVLFVLGKLEHIVYTHAHLLQMNDARLFRPHIVCAWLDECFVLNVFHALLLHLHII